MAVIRHISIRNFRAVRQAEWCPGPGLNCLIGPGDSGKSTIIDAIDLVLGARRSFTFSDADVHLMNTAASICISITLRQLDDGLLNLEAYGRYFRGFNIETKEIHDEPLARDETVLTLRMVVEDDLEPDWLLFSERTTAEGLEKRLQWKHREQLSPTRLGAASHHHLAWGNRSVLNKLSDEDFNDRLSAEDSSIGEGHLLPSGLVTERMNKLKNIYILILFQSKKYPINKPQEQ